MRRELLDFDLKKIKYGLQLMPVIYIVMYFIVIRSDFHFPCNVPYLDPIIAVRVPGSAIPVTVMRFIDFVIIKLIVSFT